MYFTDLGSYQVKKVTAATGILNAYVGNGVVNEYGGENRPALATSLAGIGAITGDLKGKSSTLYIYKL